MCIINPGFHDKTLKISSSKIYRPYCRNSLHALAKRPFALLSCILHQVLEGCCKNSPKTYLLQSEQPRLSQPVFTRQVLQPLDHLGGSLDLFQQLQTLRLGVPDLDTGFKVGLHENREQSWELKSRETDQRKYHLHVLKVLYS